MSILLGLIPFHRVSTADTNLTVVKSTGGQLGNSIVISNSNASSFRYLKLFNKGTNPTLGTDVPVWTVAVPPNAAGPVPLPHGLGFNAGIAFAITANPADNDNTAIGANEVIVDLAYQ